MTARRGNFRIDGERLWASIHEMAAIGATPNGGSQRLALSAEDGEARRLFQDWCEAAGLTISVDAMGSMFARRAGADETLEPVLVGSHLDTQPLGGKYDGVLGVLAALELVRALDDHSVRTRRPIEVVNWTNEEGSRFAPSMLASGVFAGIYDEAWANDRLDADGVRFGDALDSLGWRGPLAARGRPIHAYLELHIEQGPILEAEGVDIGVVTSGQGLTWIDVALIGRAAHAGSTPMNRRSDALTAAASVIAGIETLAQTFDDDAVGTVGRLDASPNSRNVVPGRVDLGVDLRHPTAAGLAALGERFETLLAQAAERPGVAIEQSIVEAFPPVAFDLSLADQVRAAADRLGLSRRDIVSGAGHDACCMAAIAPTALIFCPCVDGLSHNEAEAILPDWATNGAAVLAEAALDVAEAAN